MLDKTLDMALYDPVWRAAEPYMRVRKNDVHIPLSFAWAIRLLEKYPDADRDVCLLAIMLHDIGWQSIEEAEIFDKGFSGPNMLQSDLRYLHEAEGVRLATEVLKKTGWSEDVTAQVCEIIDGHDTRAAPLHLNDRIVRDADKLWRFDIPGIAVACDWFKTTPRGYANRLETQKSSLETEAGRKFATETLAETRRALMLHVI